jgi:hypothetical protein
MDLWSELDYKTKMLEDIQSGKYAFGESGATPTDQVTQAHTRTVRVVAVHVVAHVPVDTRRAVGCIPEAFAPALL